MDNMIQDLMVDSGLPGARANLSKVEAFSLYIKEQEKPDVLFKSLLEMWNTQADGNDPETIIVLSALLSMSHFYFEETYTDTVKTVFKEAMNDERWRVREIIQESFIVIASIDYEELILYFSTFQQPTALEYRAMITTVAHPQLLKSELQRNYSLTLLKKSFDAYLDFEKKLDPKDETLIALQKGLSYAPSVIVAAYPKEGFKIMERYVGRSKGMDRILKENLKKNRILKKYPEMCLNLENKIKNNV